MTDEQKFNLCGKLCHEILGAFVDEALPLNADSQPILVDTLTILASKVLLRHFIIELLQGYVVVFAGDQAECSE